MKNKNIYTIITIVTFLLFANSCSKNAQKQLNHDFTWTYTYVKSKENHRKDLKKIILKKMVFNG